MVMALDLDLARLLLKARRKPPPHFEGVPNRAIGLKKMKHQGQIKRADHFRERTQVRTLIADLQRIIDILDADIELEEQQAGVTDLARREYPVLARALRARRDNLSETISGLRYRAHCRGLFDT